MRFKKKNDYYLDVKTSLKWTLENQASMTWDEAMKRYPQNGDWRLPTIEELLTLVDYGLMSPATELPDMRPAYYWSSTTYAYNTNYACNVNFHNGNDHNYYKYFSRYVRTVRG